VKLRDYLLERGIRQSDFAEAVDVGRAHLSCIITGKRTPGKRLSRALSAATNGDIQPEDFRNGNATGYEGKVKRVKGTFTQPEKVVATKVFSLI